MIAGLEKITGGTLEIDGMVVNDVPPSQRGIAMVFQSYALYPHMTVYDNMAFALKIAKQRQGHDRQEGQGGGGQAAADELPQPPAQGAVGRAAAAGGDRPVDRARPQGVPVRRTAVEPRRGAACGHAHRDRTAEGIRCRTRR
jgi:ABC-type sugar transport system ATPase subunit